MSVKPTRPDDQAQAVARNLKTSPQKLNLVAATIRGRAVESVLASLAFMPQKMAREVHKVVTAAVANAENNHGLDVDRLYVKEAFVGKSFVVRRFHARGRGRSARVTRPFSQITVVVAERGAA